MPLLSSVMSVAVRTKVEPLSVMEPLRQAVRVAGTGQVPGKGSTFYFTMPTERKSDGG
jgi:hypothetical protein